MAFLITFFNSQPIKPYGGPVTKLLPCNSLSGCFHQPISWRNMKLILSYSINSQKALELPPWKTYLISVMCHHYCWSQAFDNSTSPFLMIWQASDMSPIDTAFFFNTLFFACLHRNLLGWKNISIISFPLDKWYILKPTAALRLYQLRCTQKRLGFLLLQLSK